MEEATEPKKKRGRPKGSFNVACRKLSPEQESELIRRFGMRQPVMELSKMFGISRQGIYNLLMRNNIPYKRRTPDAPFIPGESRLPIPTKTRIVHDRLMGKSVKAISEEQHVHRNTVDRVLVEAGVPKLIEQGKLRVHEMIPKALDVYEEHLDARNLEAARDIVRGTGVLKFNEQNTDGQQSGGFTLNMALLTAGAAKELVTSLRGDSRPAVLDVECDTDERRAGQPEPVQDVPTEAVLSQPASTVDERKHPVRS